MGNCCVTPSGSSPKNKKAKKKNKQNLFSIDYGTANGSGVGNKITVLKDPTGCDISLRYDLGRELGRGEFGITYLATDVETGDKFACKSISKSKLRTAVDMEDVRREVEIMKHLPKHPNIVSLKDSYEDDDAVHIVMELCEGGELFDRIVARGQYTERAAAAVMRTIVEVVQACHRNGVIHRDLKPENFIFGNKKETAPLKQETWQRSEGLDKLKKGKKHTRRWHSCDSIANSTTYRGCSNWIEQKVLTSGTHELALCT